MTTYNINDGQPANLVPGDIVVCPYSGSIKELTIPRGQFKLECWGAKGGDCISESSGAVAHGYGQIGGYSNGIYKVETSKVIYLVSGGKGEGNSDSDKYNVKLNGGYNGGGNSKGVQLPTKNLYVPYTGAGAGGGATHIGLKSALLTAFSSDYSSQLLIVAGAGGGGGCYAHQNNNRNYIGGFGGGNNGGSANSLSSSSIKGSAGKGGTQSSGGLKGYVGEDEGEYEGTNGSFGLGGSYGSQAGTSGGGSGFYGGGSGAGSGGGSSYYNTLKLINCSTIDGGSSMPSPNGGTEIGHNDNGYIRITVIKVASIDWKVKVNGSWKNTSAVYVKVNGAWKEASEAKSNVNGAWR